MEEILASIRRIISEDEHGLAAPKASELVALPPKFPAVPVSAADIDALFSARVAEFAAPPVVEPRQEEPRVEQAEPVADTEPRMLRPASAPVAEPVRTVAPAPIAAAPAIKPAAVETASQPLLSAATDALVQSAFGNLANTVQAGNSQTLEDLVKDMLRPMLKSWLDSNLPPLVERLVRDEIERVSRGR